MCEEGGRFLFLFFQFSLHKVLLRVLARVYRQPSSMFYAWLAILVMENFKIKNKFFFEAAGKGRRAGMMYYAKVVRNLPSPVLKKELCFIFRVINAGKSVKNEDQASHTILHIKRDCYSPTASDTASINSPFDAQTSGHSKSQDILNQEAQLVQVSIFIAHTHLYAGMDPIILSCMS
jgi:hypothetical protein